MRIVSLVPSLTEAVAATGMLVGATDYCTHPSDLDVPRVGGSKYPSVDKVLDLRPDLVLANVEENRKEDVDAMRAAGVEVLVIYPRTVAEALADLRTIFQRLDEPAPPWLPQAEQLWTTHPAISRTAAIPVWRRPWVLLGPGTFAGDVLRHLGVSNVYDDSPDPYPRPPLTEILARDPDLIVLPDEPYLFTSDDGPEAFPGVPCVLVSGRHLTWYGPSLVEAADILRDQLNSAV